MPTKKRGAKKPISMPIATRKERRTYRKNPLSFAEGTKGVASKVMDAVGGNGLVHALGGYAGTRFGGRILRAVLLKKFPALAKHGGPLGNLLVATAIYFTVQKWKKLREEAMIGAAVAIFQSLVQTYLPGLGFFIDADPALMPAAKPMGEFPGRGRHDEIEDEPGTIYVSPGEPGSGYGAPSNSPPPRASAASVAEPVIDEGIDDGLSDIGEEDMGIFNP